MKFDLQSVLQDSYSKNRLSPFYILKTTSSIQNPRDYLESWLEQLLSHFIAQTKSLSIERALEIIKQGHADILWPRREDPTKNYNIKDGDLNPLFSFMEYSPLELQWRFAVVEDPHKLSSNYLNKLLKTLEEPPANTSIVFLDYNSTQFLDTIHSRATEFTLVDNSNSPLWSPAEGISNVKDWLEKRKEHYPNLLGNEENLKAIYEFFENGKGLSDIVEKLRYLRDVDNELSGLVVEFESERPGRFKQKQRLCEELKWFNQSKTFNNPSWERILGLLCVVDS